MPMQTEEQQGVTSALSEAIGVRRHIQIYDIGRVVDVQPAVSQYLQQLFGQAEEGAAEALGAPPGSVHRH